MIYCELSSDTEILNNLEGKGSIVLVGCPGCSSFSLHFRKATEGVALMSYAPNGFKTISMRREIDRLRRLLADNGFKTSHLLGKYPAGVLCVSNKDGQKRILKSCRGPDTIITLCCDAGTTSMVNILKDKKVIPAMRAKGTVTELTRSYEGVAQYYIAKTSTDIVSPTMSV